MLIRNLVESDIPILKELHDKYFSEFNFSNFLQGFIGAFVITDKNDKLIMGGGIRPIAETILITDKTVNPHLLGDALLEALRFSLYTCGKLNIDLLHAWVTDKTYSKHLIKHGFTPRKGECLNMRLE